MFRNRLEKVWRHNSKLARRQGVSCFRVYDHDLPEFPLCIELYGDKIYLAEYRRNHGLDDAAYEEWLQTTLLVITEIMELPADHIYLRQRQRKAGRQGQYARIGEQEEFITVEEGGLKFRVNLTDYLDSGLFLDHRITRGMVRNEAMDKTVLNLFCYTGSFSVYAAAGGARKVVSVDLSRTYLKWAEENMRLNGWDKGQHEFVAADVKQYLYSLPPNEFDLVVMDPPTFSNSKRMKDFLEIQRDHVPLLNLTLQSVKPGGRIYFSTNYRRFVIEPEKIQASSIKDITRATTPFDFQGKLFRYCYLIVK